MLRYTWGPLDSVWAVAAAYLAVSGWPDVPTFVAQIQADNGPSNPNGPRIWDWGSVPVGTTITLVFAQ